MLSTKNMLSWRSYNVLKTNKQKKPTMQSLYKGYLKMEYAVIYSEWLCYTID